jgi:drug/metabolite transporter (DMT)-like permease
LNHALRSALLLAIAAQFGFAAKAIFIKLAYRAQPSLDAITLLTWRMLASLPFFLLLAWWAQRSAGDAVKPAPIARNDAWRIIGLGFIGYYLASYLDFLGLQYISAALERLILFVNPTLVALLSWAFLGFKITRTHALALVLTYVGIVLAYWHDLRITTDAHALALGSGLVFASAVAYAIYLVTSAGLTRRVGSARFTAYMMIVATGFVLGHFSATRPFTALIVAPNVWGWIACLAIFSTVLPVWMTAEALKRAGANQTAMVGTIGPIFTIALGVALLDESVSGLQLLGAALTIGGVTLMSKKNSA